MLISHPSEEGFPEKPLFEHLQNVSHICRETIASQKLNLMQMNKMDLGKLSSLIGLFHDFGKATSWFQNYIRGHEKSSHFTNHSLFSAIVGYYAVLQEMKNEKWAYIAYMIIKRHHGNLESFEQCGDKLNLAPVKEQLKNIQKTCFDVLSEFYHRNGIELQFLSHIDWNDFKHRIDDSDEFVMELSEQNDDDSFETFFLINYLFSLLIDSDKQDAARLDNSYFCGNLTEEPSDVMAYVAFCRKNEPKKFAENIPINRYRNQFLNEIHNNPMITPKNHFYSITAPTGIGKTFGCLAFANTLKRQLPLTSGRIIYCLPYTSIIDQNYEEFEKIILFNKGEKYKARPHRYLQKHHYLTPKIIENRTENQNLKTYLDDQLLVESWQASMIVTTFVQFFQTIIGYRNRFLKKFHNIVNSIVIMDEIQNIDPNYHRLLQKALKVLGNSFNTYFLQITATQPHILEQTSLIELVNSSYFMKADIFKRVALHIDKQPSNWEDFADTFCKQFHAINCLIVVNTKSMARNLYQTISNRLEGYAFYCLTTYLTPFDRKKKITEIRQMLRRKKPVIVISTQLIEAGVDVSFSQVYRDLAPLDSIIQVAGRCNRSGESGRLGGRMNLVNLQNSRIYPPILLQYVEDIIIKPFYTSSDFYDLSNAYFARFSFSRTSHLLINAIKELNYDKKQKDQIPVCDFSLIPPDTRQNIYLLGSLKAQQDMEELVFLKHEIRNEPDEEKRKDMRLKFEKLKYALIPFQISIYEHELREYRDLLEPQEELQINPEYPFVYISYKDQQKYAYDENLGFLAKPKKQIDSALVF